MKQNGKLIGILAIVLLLLVCGGIYTAYRLHPENFIGQGEIITRGEFAAILVRDIPLDNSNAEKDRPAFTTSTDTGRRKTLRRLLTQESSTLPITLTAFARMIPSPAQKSSRCW